MVEIVECNLEPKLRLLLFSNAREMACIGSLNNQGSKERHLSRVLNNPRELSTLNFSGICFHNLPDCIAVFKLGHLYLMKIVHFWDLEISLSDYFINKTVFPVPKG